MFRTQCNDKIKKRKDCAVQMQQVWRRRHCPARTTSPGPREQRHAWPRNDKAITGVKGQKQEPRCCSLAGFHGGMDSARRFNKACRGRTADTRAQYSTTGRLLFQRCRSTSFYACLTAFFSAAAFDVLSSFFLLVLFSLFSGLARRMAGNNVVPNSLSLCPFSAVRSS